jgi:hypothetical protein
MAKPFRLRIKQKRNHFNQMNESRRLDMLAGVSIVKWLYIEMLRDENFFVPIDEFPRLKCNLI